MRQHHFFSMLSEFGGKTRLVRGAGSPHSARPVIQRRCDWLVE